MDVYAVEQTGYRGRYFVLKGHLSPLDGLGPESIGVPELLKRMRAKEADILAGRFSVPIKDEMVLTLT